MTSPVSDDFLRRLVADFDSDDTVAFAVTGSHARGDHAPFSDLDILRFANTLPTSECQQYRLVQRENFLVSISTMTIATEREKLSSPETAIRAVPGLRQMKILLDKKGELAVLKQEAQAFRWEPLQEKADAFASYTLMGYAEEAHKVINGLSQSDESMTMYGSLGLYMGMVKALAVQRGVLIESENSYFRQAQESAGRDSSWTRWLRLAAGFDLPSIAQQPAYVVRGVASLRLYQETARLMRGLVLAQHREVVDATLAAIEQSGLTDIQ